MIFLPAFKDVPEVSAVEAACRLAGEIPRDDPNRAHAHRRVRALLCQDNLSRADLKMVARYVMGKFDRKPGQGRPQDLEGEWRRRLVAEKVKTIKRDEWWMSTERALWIFLAENAVELRVIENGVERVITSDNDVDEELFDYLRSCIKR